MFLNGSRGNWFKHYTGLRQGDLLSPMLFILAMEPLQLLIHKAVADGALQNISVWAARLRLSLYADDAALFLRPIKEEVTKVQEILPVFGTASGLLVNTSKSASSLFVATALTFRKLWSLSDVRSKSFLALIWDYHYTRDACVEWIFSR